MTTDTSSGDVVAEAVPFPADRHSGVPIGLRRHLAPEAVAGDAVYLVGESGVTALQGRSVPLLVDLLDGTRDAPAVLAGLRRGGVPAAAAEAMLGALDTAGLLVPHAPVAPAGPTGVPDAPADLHDPAVLAYLDAAGLDALSAADRLASTTVGLHVLDGSTAGRLLTEELTGALRGAGLRVDPVTGPSAVPGRLTVVACADYGDPALAAVDREHRRAGSPWLVVKPSGVQVWAGPVFRPDAGPCWTCLAARLTANRPVHAHVRAQRTAGAAAAPPADVRFPPAVRLACAAAALLASSWVLRPGHSAVDRIWTCTGAALGVVEHPVTARPQCPTCGDPGIVARRAARPVELGPRRKAYSGDGGDRAAAPEETLRRYRHLVGPVTGVVTEVRRDERGPAFFQSCRSGLNRAAVAPGPAGMRSALRCDNGGKGVTAVQAEVGALCEAVERHSGTFHGDEAVVHGSFRELADRAVHPDAYRLFDPAQFARRAAWNAAHSLFQQVPEPFDVDAVIPWTPVWSLTAQRHRLLPTASLYYRAPGPGGLTADSNGCAAGASPEDAVLQGLLELVERDAVGIWWYNRTSAPLVEFDPADPWIRELTAVYAGLGREVWTLDVSSDLGIPVVAAVSRRVGAPREDIMFGFGAHLDRAVAVRRALTELNQSMPAMIEMECSGPPADDVDMRRWMDGARIADHGYLAPARDLPPLPPDDPAHVATTDLHVDLTAVRTALETRGLEVLVLDQTRPDVGLPVVRTVVPGLRHFWSRFAPGRLFDVPVQLGRTAAPTPLDQLNPFPIFM